MARSPSSKSRRLSEDEELLLYGKIRDQRIAAARQYLLPFTKHTMPEFRINWHHRLACHYLDKFVSREITRLMIFQPPRTGKSELVSRRLPSFIFGRDPEESIIASSYADSLASLMNRDTQRIIDSDSYREVFPHVSLSGENVRTNAQGSWLRNNDIFEIVGHKGVYRSAGIGAGITGMGGKTLILDDPIKDQKQADSLVYRDFIWEWYISTFYTRLVNAPGKPGRILITLTRWHEDDIAGRLLALARSNPKADQWTVLSLPSIREDMENPNDPRQIGEALWPDVHSVEELEKIKASSSRFFLAMHQQRPSPEAGAILKREHWKYWKVLPADLSRFCQSWDLTFTEGPGTDFVSGQVWACQGANRYLVYRFKARAGFNGQIEAIKQLSAKFPQATAKYIEKSANGYSVQQALMNRLQGIILVPVKGSKTVRAEAVAPQIVAGNVWLPDPSVDPTIMDLVEEAAAFPYGKHDDEVDAMSQALSQLEASSIPDVAPISITGPSKWTRY